MVAFFNMKIIWKKSGQNTQTNAKKIKKYENNMKKNMKISLELAKD